MILSAFGPTERLHFLQVVLPGPLATPTISRCCDVLGRLPTNFAKFSFLENFDISISEVRNLMENWVVVG